MYVDRNPKHWKFFVFYYNPDNPRLFVTKRSGLPFTLNFAKTTPWILLSGILAAAAFFAVANN